MACAQRAGGAHHYLCLSELTPNELVEEPPRIPTDFVKQLRLVYNYGNWNSCGEASWNVVVRRLAVL